MFQQPPLAWIIDRLQLTQGHSAQPPEKFLKNSHKPRRTSRDLINNKKITTTRSLSPDRENHLWKKPQQRELITRVQISILLLNIYIWLKGTAKARETQEKTGWGVWLLHMWVESGAGSGMRRGFATGKVCSWNQNGMFSFFSFSYLKFWWWTREWAVGARSGRVHIWRPGLRSL